MQLTRRRLIALIGGGLSVAALLILVAVPNWTVWWNWQGGQSDPAHQLVFDVPPGTVERLNRGEAVEILPHTIRLTLGGRDTLVIKNNDRLPVTVGPLIIDPGQRFVERFYQPGSYQLACSLHPEALLQILVERASD
ncbi:MAG: hypothetical protein HY259_03685 [Chloroflexi bacterium]|nr:hypothetical protein [Chloroflexota bacterium]